MKEFPGLDFSQFRYSQARILNILKDGCAHTLEELQKALESDAMSKNAVHIRFSFMRLKLKSMGYTIATDCINRKFYYRLVSIIDKDV